MDFVQRMAIDEAAIIDTHRLRAIPEAALVLGGRQRLAVAHVDEQNGGREKQQNAHQGLWDVRHPVVGIGGTEWGVEIDFFHMFCSEKQCSRTRICLLCGDE